MPKKTPAKQKKVEPLTGVELIQKVKQLDHQLSKEEKAKAKSIQNSKFKIQNCEYPYAN